MTSYLVRPEAPTDIDGIRAVTAAAFGGNDEAELVDALRRSDAWIEGLSVVAVSPAGEILGHVLLTRCHVGETPGLCLAPCSVLPDHQRSGVGTAIIEEVLRVARLRGERLVVVLGHPDYYPRFGFQRASTAGISVPFPAPDEAVMVLSLELGRSLPTGEVRYPEPFGL